MIAENNAKRGDRWNLDDGGFWRMGREAPGAPQKKTVKEKKSHPASYVRGSSWLAPLPT